MTLSRKIDKHIEFIVRADIRFLNTGVLIPIIDTLVDTLLHSTNRK